MSSRHTSRRPNRRQIDPSGILRAPLTLSVHGTLISGGNTVIQVDALGAAAIIDAHGNDAVANQITLTGLVNGLFTTQPCIEITAGASTGDGVGFTLVFDDVIDILSPWEVRIPSGLQAFGLPAGGRPAGTLTADEAVTPIEGGYLRLTNNAQDAVGLAPLMFVDQITDDGGNLLRFRTINAGGGYVITGPITLTDASGGGPTTATPTQLSANEFTFQFATPVGPSNQITCAAWQAGIRGTNGSWLAPFGQRCA